MRFYKQISQKESVKSLEEERILLKLKTDNSTPFDLKKFAKDKISSTVIRNALIEGKLDRANKMLGYFH